jgi:hypothetical protein
MTLRFGHLGFLLSGVFGITGCFEAGLPDRGDDDETDAACQTDNDCKGTRICVDGSCVDDPAGAGGGATGGAPGGGGTASNGGTPSTAGVAGEGSAGAPTTCTSSSPIRCPNSGSMELCVNGTYETYACSTACASLGFATGPCAAGIGCDCGTATN